MSKPKFTPGPWAVESHFDEPEVVSCNERDANEKEAGVIYVIAGRIGGMVHGERFDDFSEVEANRSLIAAAPAMYAMLEKAAKAMWSSAANMDAEAAEIEELLAKVRGES